MGRKYQVWEADGLRGHRRPHIRQLCAMPAANSMKFGTATGCEGPGLGQPKKSKHKDIKPENTKSNWGIPKLRIKL